MKRKFYRIVSFSLLICIFTTIFSSFLLVPDKKRKMGVSVVVVKASDAVVTEVISDVLLELLASLGVSATGYVLGKTNQADKVQEAYEKYVAENTNGVTFVVGSVAYNITHPGVSKTISNTLVQQVQDAINNSPEAREEFEKLIQAVTSGAQITGSMLKNLWLMLTKGAIDDYNASISNHDTTVYQNEWDIFKYENWSEEMKDIYNSGYKSYVFFSYMGQMEIALFPIDFHPPSAVDDGEFPLTIKNIGEKTYFGVDWTDEADCYIFRFLNPLDDKYSEYFPNSILTGWEYANGIQNNFYGISDYVGNSYDDNYNFLGHYYGYQFNSIIWWQDTVGDMIFGIPNENIDIPGDDSEPCVVNPNKVITDMPEKIVNDEPIEIPDGTTIDDVVANPALPGEIVGGIPVNDVVTGVVGEFVPVQDIDFPWENDVPVEPNLPEKPPKLPDWLQTLLDWLQKIIDAILGLASEIIDGILDGLKKLFVPSEDFFTTHFSSIKEKLANKFGFSKYELFFDALKNCAKGVWDFKFKFKFLGHEYNLQIANVDEWFSDSNIYKLHYLIRGFFFPLIILANINFAIWFLRGTYLFSPGGSSGNISGTSDSTFDGTKFR